MQLRFARDEIDRRGERAIRAVIRDLGREINRDAERDAQDIQEREEWMTPQMPENVPGKNPRVLGGHLPSLQTTFGVRQAIVMNPNVSPRRSHV